MRERLKRFTKSANPFTWFENHTRIYYSLFYFVTSAFFLALAYYTNMTLPALEQYYWLGSKWWVAFFILEALFLIFLGFDAIKKPTTKGFRGRFKQFATLYGVGLILFRGLNIYRLGVGGLALLIVPLWAAFILAWVVPLLWYLPTKLSEYKALRERTDVLESRLKALESENEVGK